MRQDSVAFLIFDFEREIGYFILYIYFPLNLVVGCSWVAFWIVKTDVPARVALGVTTVLSVTKIGIDGKGKPQVGYSTALDIYNIICFFYTFAALTEFAIINFIPKFIKRYKDREEAKQQGNNKNAENENIKEEDIFQRIGEIKLSSEFKNRQNLPSNEDKCQSYSYFYLKIKTIPWKMLRLLGLKFGFRSNMKFSSSAPALPWVPRLLMYDETQYVIDRLDEVCRIVFPLSYLIIQFGYWTYYFYIAQDV